MPCLWCGPSNHPPLSLQGPFQHRGSPRVPPHPTFMAPSCLNLGPPDPSSLISHHIFMSPNQPNSRVHHLFCTCFPTSESSSKLFFLPGCLFSFPIQLSIPSQLLRPHTWQVHTNWALCVNVALFVKGSFLFIFLDPKKNSSSFKNTWKIQTISQKKVKNTLESYICC